ncbi:MAG: sel1 repeat family protein [Ruminococcus sp.]|nr:sel1 repeat family protein [Ruminococcus sp.]
MSKTVKVTYDSNSLQTTITVDGKPFDTSRINGKEIADWVYPFMMRKVRWNGIFEELAKVVGSDEYTIQFSGSNAAMLELMEECPEGVSLIKAKDSKTSIKRVTVSSGNVDSKIQNYLNKIEIVAFNESEESRKNSPDISDEDITAFIKYAEKGNAKAQYALFRINFQETDEYTEESVAWLKKSAKQGLTEAEADLGFYYYHEDNDENAIYWFLKAANKGSVDAMKNLGFIYYMYSLDSLCSDDDSDYDSYGIESFKWYKKAADLGNTEAQSEVASFLKRGIGVVQNYAEAIKWYEACLNNPLISEYQKKGIYKDLGDIYFDGGNGIRKDSRYAKAVQWYEACLNSHLIDEDMKKEIYENLGYIYFDGGKGIRQDYQKAYNYYHKSAELGSADAANMVGLMYKNGYYVTESISKANEWYKKAINGGNSIAKYNYAVNLINNGNFEKALDLLVEAADEGVEAAQEFLDENGVSY